MKTIYGGLTVLPLALAGLVGCSTPRTADNVTLARVAKDYIGVASIDDLCLEHPEAARE